MTSAHLRTSCDRTTAQPPTFHRCADTKTPRLCVSPCIGRGRVGLITFFSLEPSTFSSGTLASVFSTTRCVGMGGDWLCCMVVSVRRRSGQGVVASDERVTTKAAFCHCCCWWWWWRWCDSQLTSLVPSFCRPCRLLPVEPRPLTTGCALFFHVGRGGEGGGYS